MLKMIFRTFKKQTVFLMALLLASAAISPVVTRSDLSTTNSILAQEGTTDPQTDPDPEPDPEPAPANYKITVSATYQGGPIEGIEMKLSGNGTNKSLTTSLSGANEFTGLTAGSYTISILFPSESDYQLPQGVQGSTTVNLSETNQSETVVFSLAAKEPEKDENLEKIQSINLPEKLTKIGSTTTIISKIPEDQLESVSNFTFDNPGVNKIVYQENLDLSNYNDYSKISIVSDYIDLESIGKVRFDADLLPPFDKRAKIIMSQVKLVELEQVNNQTEEDEDSNLDQIAVITRDGQEIEVSDLNYNKEAQELSFVVDGFSTYTIKPRLVVDFSELTPKETEGEEISDVYTYDKIDYKFTIQVDNLDATVNVFNNNEILNIPTEPNENGEISSDIQLAQGKNRIKVEVKLSNGEKTEQFFTIEVDSPEEENNVSNTFGILFFIIILISGAGLGIYYLRLKKKQAAKSDKNNKNGKAPDKKSKGFAYDPNLLTDEEKELYGGGEDSKNAETNKNLQKNNSSDASNLKKENENNEKAQKERPTEQPPEQAPE